MNTLSIVKLSRTFQLMITFLLCVNGITVKNIAQDTTFILNFFKEDKEIILLFTQEERRLHDVRSSKDKTDLCFCTWNSFLLEFDAFL